MLFICSAFVVSANARREDGLLLSLSLGESRPFLPRDARSASAVLLSCVVRSSVRPSVCLSVCPTVCL